jgi:hypothetical protein
MPVSNGCGICGGAMAVRRTFLCAVTAVCFSMLGGCGTYVPQMQEVWDGKSDEVPNASAGGALEFRIKQKVYCDIVAAVNLNQDNLPRNWGVQVSLDLQVDETGAINPGASLIKPLDAGQSFTLGLGATVSTQGTREDKYGSYWNLDRLRNYDGGTCNQDRARMHGSSLLLESDLGIADWLRDHLVTQTLLPSSRLTDKNDPTFKQDVLSYHVKFVVISSGSVTPTWKLVRVASGNGSLPLASAGRTRTHDLLVTFGPAFKPGAANIALSSHQAQEIGIAVSNGNRSLVAP